MVEYEYAKALFDLATEENKIESFNECFNIIIDSVKQHSDFHKLMGSPLINQEEKKKIVQKVYYAIDSSFLRFLNVLIDHNRFDLLPSIKDEYHRLMRDYQNVLEVEVISSEKLKKQKLNQLLEQLEIKYPQKKIMIQNTVDSKMIYGIQILCDGKSIDLSLKNRINQLKDSL